jgi:hypothetical protein
VAHRIQPHETLQLARTLKYIILKNHAYLCFSYLVLFHPLHFIIISSLLKGCTKSIQLAKHISAICVNSYGNMQPVTMFSITVILTLAVHLKAQIL